MMKRYQEALTTYEQVLLVDNDNINIIRSVNLLQKYLTNPKNTNNKFSFFKLRVTKKEVLTKSLKKIQIIFAILLLSIICYLAYNSYNSNSNIDELVRSVEVSRLSNDFEEALSSTDEILTLFPNSNIGYELKIDILFELERYGDTIVYIDKLIANDQNNISIYKLKGIA